MRRLLCFLPLLAAFAVPSAAAAQSTVRVEGTTDTTDSGLIDDVIKPGFEAAYPQYKLQYHAVGTGQALTNARAGQADAVLTHAPSSEKSFVDDGYSYEPVGRAIFFNDYVIISQNRDPAGVLAGANHDAVHALELIAAAGVAGNAFFVSRGDNSGTHVQEGLMWAQTTGVPTHPLTNGRVEPDGNGDGVGTDVPAWYKKAGVGQAATVSVANQCNFGEPRDRCYVMTDRGTYDRLQQTGAITGMRIDAEKNAASARGGANLLINPFHVYAVSPAKFSTVNLAGAVAFMDYLTSPGLQTALLSYPSAANPRFFPDALPDLAMNSPALPAHITAGDSISVSGMLFNRLPGAGVVKGAPLSLQSSLGLPGSPFAPQATTFADRAGGVTSDTGGITLSASPTRSGAVRVASTRYGDLSPATFPVGTVTVGATVDLKLATATYRRIRLQGTSAPGSDRQAAKLTVVGRRLPSTTETQVGEHALPASGSAFDFKTALAPGRWRLKLQYQDPGVVDVGESRTVEVRVPGHLSLSLRAPRRLKHHRVRVRGSFSPGAAGRKARVELFAHRRGAKGGFKRVASRRPRKAQRRYSFTVRLRPGRWQLRVRYRHSGVIDTTTSRTRSVSVR